MPAQDGDIVTVHLSVRVIFGETVHSTKGGEPLRLEAGKGPIPAVGEAVIGMEVEQVKTLVVRAEDAFGLHDPALFERVPRTSLPPEIKVGDRLLASGEQKREVTVLELDAAEAIIDWNHPLAGQALVIKVQLMSIGQRKAS